jgi:hypothetical protein
MQAIATTNAKADMKMEGRKYGNLSQKESFGNICGYFTVGCKVLEKQVKEC